MSENELIVSMISKNLVEPSMCKNCNHYRISDEKGKMLSKGQIICVKTGTHMNPILGGCGWYERRKS